MLLKKGIVRKTFLFSAALILFVILISFAVMYFIMPGYYLVQKEKTLKDNLDALTSGMQSAKTGDECAALIADFSAANNVTVLSFDENEVLLPALSTPFIGMKGNDAVFFSEKRQISMDEETSVFTIQIRPGDGNTRIKEASGLNLRWAAPTGGNAMIVEGKVGTEFVDHVLVNGTLQPIDEARSVILSLIPYVLAVAIVVCLISSGIYARQISKPILRISDVALRMQQMEPGVESGIKTKDELGQLSVNMDVLYAKLLENIERLKNEMDKVNRLERSKTELMQNASHELKTPIAALNGMLEGMIDNVGAYKNRDKYLEECKNQVDKLSHLVAEILGASKSDIFDTEMELSDVYADELVERAIAENMYQIHEKQLRLEQDLPSALIVTDSGILYHSVSNLISNAVRYTPLGGVIRVSIFGEEDTRRLTIENECEPIPQDEIQKLFEPFYTRSYSRDKTKSGTGLGLYIVKRSLERLGIHYEAKITDLGFLISLSI